jgi:iron complex transport system substrate-binding protein
MIKRIPFIFAAFLLLINSCNQKENGAENTRTITDMLGREISVPDTITRIVGVRAGALRMITYMGAAKQVVGVEENELRDWRPYSIANPYLLNLSTIGPMMGGDSELILNSKPDVIFITYATVADANALQKRTGIPVIAIDCPEFGTHRHILYESLNLMAEILHKTARADSLIAYIENSIQDLDSITSNLSKQSKPKVYVGGVSYSGSHGITSTQPYYPPFEFTNAKNVAKQIAEEKFSHVKGTFIDIEQLLAWNPDVLFIDCGGIELVQKSIKEKKILERNIAAFKNEQMYVLYAYNNYANNYEMVLANSWYVAKKMYPGEFAHIDIKEKVNEITKMFLGKPIYDELIAESGAYTEFKIRKY